MSDTHPPLLSPEYLSSRTRAPRREPLRLQSGRTEVTGPVLGEGRVGADDADLTRDADGEADGQRIVVAGRVLDEDGRPIRNSLLEGWQANAAGRYRHSKDRWPAPLDPHFTGLGRALTDDDGGYRFLTVRPGAYPWRNHHNGQGSSTEDAAVACGVSPAVGARCSRQGGGMPRMRLTRPSGRFLSFAEREEIAVLRAQRLGVREIARQLGRSPSTISREVRRNAATRGGQLDYRRQSLSGRPSRPPAGRRWPEQPGVEARAAALQQRHSATTSWYACPGR